MMEKIKKITNPLTIVGMFAAITEVTATITVHLIDKSLQSVFIWFSNWLSNSIINCIFFNAEF